MFNATAMQLYSYLIIKQRFETRSMNFKNYVTLSLNDLYCILLTTFMDLR